MGTPALNVTADLMRQATLRPDAPALVCGDRSVRYQTLDRLAWLAAAWLSAQGLRRGESVALLFSDPLFLAIAMLGAARLGVTAVVIPGRATGHQSRAWAAAAGCRRLVSDLPSPPEIGLPRVMFEPAALGTGGGVIPRRLYDEFPSAPLMINIGSGSTGAPKLIPVSHANMRHRSEVSAASPVFAEDDRTLWLSGLEFTAVQNRLFNQLHAGHTLVLLPPGKVEFAELLVRESVTVVVASVFHLETLLGRNDPRDSQAFARLRAVRTGGSNVTDSLRDRVRAHLTPRLFVKYATNETGVISVCPPDEHRLLSGSVGRPLSGVELDVQAPDGEVGPVRIRHPGVIAGYLGDEAVNRERFFEGWFRPGDLAAKAPSGSFAFFGRTDDLMLCNGINIYPAEIETCLAGHPAVSDVAALPLPHPVHQDIPVCAVALRDGAEASAEALANFARKRLGSRSPARVVLLSAIPRNAQGKLVRPELLTLIRAAL